MHAVILQSFPRNSNTISAKKLPRWEQSNWDCAGLVRFAHFEATTMHSKAYRANQSHYLSANLSDLAKLAPQKTKKLKYYLIKADTMNLYNSHTRFISKDIHSPGIREADLLFYQPQPRIGHVMVILRNQRDNRWMAAYHTGDKRNQLRLIYLDDLLQHVQKSWHPNAQNPHFLGIRRLQFLD